MSDLNSLILQEAKKTQLLQIINKFNFLRMLFKNSAADEPAAQEIIPENIDELRNEWLNQDSSEELTLELTRMNLNVLRAITEPWMIKSKSKDDFFDLTSYN